MKSKTHPHVSSEDQEADPISTNKKREIMRYARNKGLTVEDGYYLSQPELVFNNIVEKVLFAKEPVVLIVPNLETLKLHIRSVDTLDKLCKQGKMEIHSLLEDVIIKKDRKHPQLLDWYMCNRFAPKFICVCKHTKKHNSNSR